MQRNRLLGPAHLLVGGRHVIPRLRGGGVVWAQHTFSVRQGPLVKRKRFLDPARRMIGDGEAVPCGQRVGVVWPKYPLQVRDQWLTDRDGLRRAIVKLN